MDRTRATNEETSVIRVDMSSECRICVIGSHRKITGFKNEPGGCKKRYRRDEAREETHQVSSRNDTHSIDCAVLCERRIKCVSSGICTDRNGVTRQQKLRVRRSVHTQDKQKTHVRTNSRETEERS